MIKIIIPPVSLCFPFGVITPIGKTKQKHGKVDVISFLNGIPLLCQQLWEVLTQLHIILQISDQEGGPPYNNTVAE